MKRYIEIISMMLPITMFFILKSHDEIKNYTKKTCINLGCSIICFTVLFFLLSNLKFNRYISVGISMIIYFFLMVKFFEQNSSLYYLL